MRSPCFTTSSPVLASSSSSSSSSKPRLGSLRKEPLLLSCGGDADDDADVDVDDAKAAASVRALHVSPL